MTSPVSTLRSLLSQPRSYQHIAAAAAAGQLGHFPVKLFGHIGEVYGWLEAAADEDHPEIAALRLAALVHEEPLESLPRLLAAAGMLDLAPTVIAVTGQFGSVWKLRTEAALRRFVELNSVHLAAVLLFELAHEGRTIPEMDRAAELAGLLPALKRWAGRLRAPTAASRVN